MPNAFTGVLVVKVRKTKAPGVQIRMEEKVYNLGQSQLSLELRQVLGRDPVSLDGSAVDFELVRGQPHRVRRKGAVPDPELVRASPTRPDRNNPRMVKHGIEPKRLEVGHVKWFDDEKGYGFIEPAEKGDKDIFLHKSGVRGNWRPQETDAVAYTRGTGRKGPQAESATPLRDCTDPGIVERCGTSSLRALWQEVAARYLLTLSADQQHEWIVARGQDVGWLSRDAWDAVHPQVRQRGDVMPLLPRDLLQTVLAASAAGLEVKSADQQRVWISERSRFLNSMPGAVWELLLPSIVWDRAVWKAAPADVRLRVFLVLTQSVPPSELLDRLDAQLVQLLHDSAVLTLMWAVLSSADNAVALHPKARGLLQAHSSKLATFDADCLSGSLALVAAIAAHPEIEKNVPREAVVQGTPLAAIAPYARFATADRPALSGSVEFSDLEPEDLILAAFYASPECDGIFRGLDRRDQWTWDSICASMNVRELAGKLDNRTWQMYLVKGIQPRAAELAFVSAYGVLRPGFEQPPRDLNRAALVGLPLWTLSAVRQAFAQHADLVSEDWEDDSHRYDVKSNLYFRSQERQLGLRGFLVDIEHERLNRLGEVLLAGVVFYATSNHDCHWSFVGVLDPAIVPEAGRPGQKVRVSALYFTAPDSLRLRDLPVPPARSAAALAGLLDAVGSANESACHPLIPLLGADSQDLSESLEEPRRLLLAEIQRAQLMCRRPQGPPAPLELVVWEAMNHLVFDSRSKGIGHDSIDNALRDARLLVRSAWFPVKLPRVKVQPLLAHWIDSVLTPLNDHWDAIRCPECGSQGASISIRPLTRSSDGSLWGQVHCKCGFDYGREDVTLLTHCHECSSFPLVIGRNEVCRQCCGLRCRSVKDGGDVCDACRVGCIRV